MTMHMEMIMIPTSNIRLSWTAFSAEGDPGKEKFGIDSRLYDLKFK